MRISIDIGGTLIMKHTTGIHQNHLYSVYFAPRGAVRMYGLGQEIAQRHLTPQDKLIGVIGDAGSGKSMIVKGMFPGLELTNDDQGVNVRPLPLMDLDEGGFFKPHTYHIDIRFETGFYQLFELADAIREAIDKGKRVIVEHFELIYPLLGRNANLLIGVGGEIIVTRPTVFGPEPDDVAKSVFKSIGNRKMAHSAEDLVEFLLTEEQRNTCEHGDVRHGFTIAFPDKPEFDIADMEAKVNELIAQDIPIKYYDEQHIRIGEVMHPCTGPRTHVPSTGQIRGFKLLPDFFYDSRTKTYLLVGQIGEYAEGANSPDLNKFIV